MWRRLLPLLLLLATLSLVGCEKTPTGRSQLALVPEGLMAEMGGEAFAEMRRQQPIARDPACFIMLRLTFSSRSVLLWAKPMASVSKPVSPICSSRAWNVGMEVSQIMLWGVSHMMCGSCIWCADEGTCWVERPITVS